MANVVMLLGSEFEDSEFRIPYDRITSAGHDVTVLGTSSGETVEGKQHREKVRIQASPDQVDPAQFDVMVIPGGHSPDVLRTNHAIVDFVRDFTDMGKTVAAVCHGPQLLIEAERVRGRRLTSWPSVRKDLENAGAEWVDKEVVEDGALITSRKPDDLEAFSKAILRRLA